MKKSRKKTPNLRKEFLKQIRVRDKKEREQKNKLRMYGNKLNKNLPKAERWFKNLFIKEQFRYKYSNRLDKHEYNSPLGNFIPDVINRHFKYVIEVDEAYHNTLKQKYIDKIKDTFYKSLGYKIFRIKEYDVNDYKSVVLKIHKLRNQPVFIVRKVR